MPTPLDELEAQALKLPAEERAELVDRLISSLFEDHEIESAWATEVEHRTEALESGRVNSVSADGAIARARAAIE